MVSIDPDLKKKIENLAKRVSKDSSDSLKEPSVQTRLIRNLEAESVFEQHGKSFRFTCDEGVWNGGHGTAPTPLRYFLSGIGFCQQVWFVKCAALMGIPIVSLNISVKTRLDIRGELGVQGIDAGLQEIIIRTEISTEMDHDDVRKLAHKVEERCPIYITLKRAMPTRHRVIHNGVEI